ncbi:MAG TPA: DNA repair protein RecN [Acidimicrobiales bacterium]|nr:DNA repair protein RecN [Acidimicrobiales bacterium]
MLAELRVRELGVIADLTVVLGPGMIALTGETGTGKTLVVEAIELLLGGRADPVLVRPGADEASVEGRFVGTDEQDDIVVARTVPAAGRSRSYVNGLMAPLATLAQVAGPLIDLHGQHSHQSLLSAAAQRAALDAYGHIDLEPIAAARRRVRDAGDALAALGGDAASRARDLDMLDFQVTEIDAAKLADPDEDAVLAAEEERLAGAASHREAANAAELALSSDAGVAEQLGDVVGLLSGHGPLAELHGRLRAVAIELADATSDLRALADSLEEDPERLAWIRQRRQLLHQLRRKYGETLAGVIEFGETAQARLAEVSSFEERAAGFEEARRAAAAELAAAEAAVGNQRRQVAPALAAAIEEQLQRLAMPRARFEVRVGDDPAGDEVVWLLGANPGEPALPLSKVASGGELARTMLAARLAIGSTSVSPASATSAGASGASAASAGESPGAEGGARGAPTLVFDEVDAGIGGEAALAVGRALSDLARHHQVLVVTHLPQVAAFADQQIAVAKEEQDGRTVASARRLAEPDRIVELSRMLSGQPDSATARRHAKELLASVRRPGAS